MYYQGRFRALPPLLGLVLLGGVAWEWSAIHLPPENLEPYHGKIKEAAERIPRRIGDWVGSDEDVQGSAVKMLRPNIIMSRRYYNSKRGTAVSFLLVHCKDTRDLQGHYPPVCYPVNGWKLQESEARDWTVNHRTIRGMQYKFSRRSVSRTNQMTIYNFLVRPNAGVEREMPGFYRASEDRRLRALGGGQVQVLFDQVLSREDRDEIFECLLATVTETLDLIVVGVP